MINVCVGIDGRIGNRLFINEIFDKFGKVELAGVNAIDNFKVFSETLFEFFETPLKVFRKLQMYFHRVLLISLN